MKKPKKAKQVGAAAVLEREGLPPRLPLVVLDWGGVRHIGGGRWGTWCGMTKWAMGSLRKANRSDWDKPLCGMCVRTTRAQGVRRR